MKKLLFYVSSLLMIFLYNPSYCQKKLVIKKHEVAGVEFLTGLNQQLTFESLSNNLNGIMGSPKTISIKNYIDPMTDSINRSGNSKEELLNKKNLSKIVDYYKNISAFGESKDELAIDGIPFVFVKYNNSLTFIQRNLWYGYDLNSLKMSQKERYKYIIERVLIPSINNFEALLRSNDIKYFAINIAYKSRNFIEETDMGSVEQITIVIPRQVAAKFINSKISDDVARKSSAFFVSTKATNGVKKLIW